MEKNFRRYSFVTKGHIFNHEKIFVYIDGEREKWYERHFSHYKKVFKSKNEFHFEITEVQNLYNFCKFG